MWSTSANTSTNICLRSNYFKIKYHNISEKWNNNGYDYYLREKAKRICANVYNYKNLQHLCQTIAETLEPLGRGEEKNEKDEMISSFLMETYDIKFEKLPATFKHRIRTAFFQFSSMDFVKEEGGILVEKKESEYAYLPKEEREKFRQRSRDIIGNKQSKLVHEEVKRYLDVVERVENYGYDVEMVDPRALENLVKSLESIENEFKSSRMKNGKRIGLTKEQANQKKHDKTLEILKSQRLYETDLDDDIDDDRIY